MKNTIKKEKIDNLFQTGKWITTPSIKAVWLPSNNFEYMVSAPIKKFRKAVDRNRIKRLLRQSIFTQNPNHISIAFIYSLTTIESFDVIYNDIKHILKITNSIL